MPLKLSCVAACESKDDCGAFSGIFNSWCIGCSVFLDAAHSGAIAYLKEDAFKAVQESTSLMENFVIEDTSKNWEKCGNPDNSNRVFDLREGHANQNDCIATCKADDECVAFSGIFCSWCIGRSVDLDTAHSFTRMNQVLSLRVMWVKNKFYLCSLSYLLLLIDMFKCSTSALSHDESQKVTENITCN